MSGFALQFEHADVGEGSEAELRPTSLNPNSTPSVTPTPRCRVEGSIPPPRGEGHLILHPDVCMFESCLHVCIQCTHMYIHVCVPIYVCLKNFRRLAQGKNRWNFPSMGIPPPRGMFDKNSPIRPPLSVAGNLLVRKHSAQENMDRHQENRLGNGNA